MKNPSTESAHAVVHEDYDGLLHGISELFAAARHATSRVTNTLMTATYWDTGRRIIEFEQGGRKRAE